MNLPISAMSTAEKLEAMEQLWLSLQVEGKYAPPQWHAEVLKRRQKRIENGEAVFSPLEEVAERLRRSDD